MNMALYPLHKYFVFNDRLQPVSTFIPSENEGGIYEVLRVVNGMPLFLEEHLQRFQHSAELAGKEIRYSCAQLEVFLNQLIARNEVKEGNILISCKTNLKAFFIAHNYPTRLHYQKGIRCGLLRAERMNPNAKVFQTEVRKQANRLMEAKGFFEVLLVDHENRITEGSRSNVFFIKGNKIITSPGKQVLLGITRQKAIACAGHLNYVVNETEIELDGLTDFDAAFISGTSPKILPIKELDEHFFNTENSVLRNLMREYDRMIEENLKKRLSGKTDD